MIVGLVCQRWRFVALNTSELWATLLLEGHGRDIAAYAPLINNWVAHSKNAPCHIKTMIWMDEESPISPLLYVFIPIASRIQTLDLTVELGELEQCLEFFKHGLPELRKIKIKLLYEMYGPEAEGLSLALDLSACPRLEEINFSDTIRRLLGQEGLLEGTPRSLKFYDHRITAEPVLAFAILYKCRTLEELRFTPPPISEWLERFDPKIKLQFTHTSLKRLSIQGTLPVHASDIQPLFQAVHFPALSDFELSDLAGSAGILRRLANTSPPLQSLNLNRCWLSTEDVIRVLEKIPSIKDLHLVGCGCHNELMIAALTAWRDGALLPNLERLNIGDDLGDELTVSDEDIVRFLESRCLSARATSGARQRPVEVTLSSNAMIGIDRLPPELLSQIFIIHYHRKGERSALPLQLGCVCKRWRQITLTLQRLWRRVNINVGSKDSNEQKQLAPYIPDIHQWLTRSGNLSCDITLTLLEVEKMAVAVQILRPIANRIQRLKLHVPFQEVVDSVDLFQAGMPRLRRLSIAGTAGNKRDGGSFPNKFVPHIHQNDVVAIPPIHLKYFNADYILIWPLIQLLEKCTQLRSMKLNLFAWLTSNDPAPYMLPTPVRHSTLCRLDIEFSGPEFARLFANVEFPCLKHLKICQISSDSDSNNILESITCMLPPPLEVFELENNTSSSVSTKLVGLFYDIPTIERLVLTNCRCLDGLLVETLTLSVAHPVQLLPKLKYLRIVEDGPSEDVWDWALLRMIESRWQVEFEQHTPKTYHERCMVLYPQRPEVDNLAVASVVGLAFPALDSRGILLSTSSIFTCDAKTL
ncbi:hypothetical protein AX16_008983 [Volvariella volvacea WC 439]|nr:hypothetical protein AX16_008983 [Volvariella volvacea WC 439]